MILEAFALIRIFLGLALAIGHGIPKLWNLKGTTAWLKSEGFPAPGLAALSVGIVEGVGGILLALGIGTRVVASIIAINMLVAVLFHIRKKDSYQDTEAALTFLVLAILIAIAGGGPWQLWPGL